MDICNGFADLKVQWREWGGSAEGYLGPIVSLRQLCGVARATVEDERGVADATVTWGVGRSYGYQASMEMRQRSSIAQLRSNRK